MRDIDLRGQRCPVLTMKLRGAMKSVQAGEQVRVLYDDPKGLTDLQAYAASSGNAMEVAPSHLSHDHDMVFITKKGVP